MSTVMPGMEAMRAPARVAAIRAWVWLREKQVTIAIAEAWDIAVATASAGSSPSRLVGRNSWIRRF
jgi:hypothetical protein